MACRLTLAIVVVIFAATPSLASFLRAGFGFRLGYPPNPAYYVGTTDPKYAPSGHLGKVVAAPVGPGGPGWQAGRAAPIISHSLSFNKAPGLVFGHGHGHTQIRPFNLFGVNLHLGQGLAKLLSGWKPLFPSAGWGWNPQVVAAPVLPVAAAPIVPVAPIPTAGWGGLVAQHSEGAGKVLTFAGKPAPIQDYYYPSHSHGVKTQFEFKDDKAAPAWHNAEKVKILYTPGPVPDYTPGPQVVRGVMPVAAASMPPQTQQSYQYTASNVDSQNQASTAQQTAASRSDDGGWIPILVPGSSDKSAEKPVVKKQLDAPEPSTAPK